MSMDFGNTSTMKFNFNIECGLEEWTRIIDTDDRRLYLNGEIKPIDYEENCMFMEASKTTKLIELIMDFNRVDHSLPEEERTPIRLYINTIL